MAITAPSASAEFRKMNANVYDFRAACKLQLKHYEDCVEDCDKVCAVLFFLFFFLLKFVICVFYLCALT